MIFEGTNEILRVLLALSGMREVGEDMKEIGKALRDPLHSLGILGDYAARKAKSYVTPQKLARLAPQLAPEGEILARYARALGGTVEGLLFRHGKEIVQREYQQERLANVAIDLYACLAVLSRATTAIAKRGTEKSAEEVRLARSFVREAKYRMVGHLKEMDKNRDAEMTATSDVIYSGPGYAFIYWE